MTCVDRLEVCACEESYEMGQVPLRIGRAVYVIGAFVKGIRKRARGIQWAEEYVGFYYLHFFRIKK